jgi:hypothetical protein
MEECIMNKINIAAIICISSLTYFQASAYGVYFKSNIDTKVAATINLAAGPSAHVDIRPGESTSVNTELFCIQSVDLQTMPTRGGSVQGSTRATPSTIFGMHCGDVHITINKNKFNSSITADVN